MTGRSKLNIPERKLILVFGDFIIILFALLFYNNLIINSIEPSNWISVFFIFSGFIVYYFLAYILNFYFLGNSPKYPRRSIAKGLIIGTLYILLLLFFSIIIWKTDFNEFGFLIFLFFIPIVLVSWRKLFFFAFKFIPTTKEVFFLYNHSTTDHLEKYLRIINGDGIHTFYQVVKALNIEQEKEPFDDKLLGISKMVDSWILDIDIGQPLPKNLETVMLNSLLQGKEVITFSTFYENIYEALPIVSHNANESCIEILQLQHTRVRYLYRIFSFFATFLICFFVLLIFLLVIPFIFVLNLIFNRGPLFFVQKRIGLHGKEYNIYKFRSMIVDAESSGAKMASKNDARITSFGRILRTFRLDELPQILSVLKGDMSIIGPRPERKVFVDKLNKITPYYSMRHIIKPGITGWAQVKYKYGENLEDSIHKLEYDLYYIKSRSVILDLRIIFKTLTTIIFSRGI